jgi:uncharacterized protein YbjQ (UPF0145 family)
MPLFGRKREASPEEDQAAEDRDRSLALIEAGDIPLQAQRRLDELRAQEKPVFSSDLSVSEFLLGREAGLRPVSQVMGSSIYHVGFKFSGAWTSTGELPIPTEALNQCRWRALRRLQLEAERVGAHAVVGVHIVERDLDWSSDVIECSSLGTAVRVDSAPADSLPALTNLSGQDFWKLYQAGYWPAGVCSGASVVLSYAPWRGMALGGFGSSWYNQELEVFTAGQYEARRRALGRIHQQAQSLRAEGLVGVQISQKQEMEAAENSRIPSSMTFVLSAIGTAVVPISGRDSRVNIRPVVLLDT